MKGLMRTAAFTLVFMGASVLAINCSDSAGAQLASSESHSKIAATTLLLGIMLFLRLREQQHVPPDED